MDTTPVISVKNITKTYRVRHRRRLLTTSMINAMGFGGEETVIHAVDNLSFDLFPGEVLGIIGRNGSGKSTILKVISGITRQDSGEIDRRGRITSLLELGAGLETELSGYENIFLLGALLHLPREYIREKCDDIIAFSGLRTFIREPVKTYSSGMIIRLAFAVAAYSKPRVMILDEVLGVGDIEFQNRCFQYIHRSIKAGISVILVSHDMSIIGNFCDRVIFLQDGRAVRMGKASDIVDWYTQILGAARWMARLQRPRLTIAFHHGNFHITYRQSLITAANGFQLIFLRENQKYSSNEFHWTLTTQDPTGFTVIGRFPNTDLILTMHIRLREDRFLDFKMVFSNGFTEYFDRMDILLMGSSRYQHYFTPEIYQALPRLKTRNYIPESVLMRTHPRRFIGLNGFEGDVEVPGILADFAALPDTGETQLLNGCAFMKARAISRSIPAVNLTETAFTVALLPEQEMEDYYNRERDRVSLSAGRLAVALVNGALHMSLDGDRLTGIKGLSAFWKEERRRRVEWEVLEVSPVLHLRATDRSRPAVYVWMFRSENDSITWTLDLELLNALPGMTLQIAIDPGKNREWLDSLVINPAPEMVEDESMLLFTPESHRLDAENKPGIYRILTGAFTLRGNS